MIWQAVFCDIDGTLLDSNHQLPPATAAKIRAVSDAGTPFILVSARSPGGMFPIQDRIGIRRPLVCYGGALVLGKDREPVHSLGLEPARVVALRDRILAEWPDAAPTVYSYDNWYVGSAADPRVVLEAEITGAVPTEATSDQLGRMEAEAHKLFCIASPEHIARMHTVLAAENPDLAVTRSSPIFLEVTNGLATKANAVRYLCQAMRLSPADAVAFGDNYNDVDMLECVGLGIAMANAPEEVRTRAGQVTAGNDEEGVRQALEHLEFQPVTNSVRFERAFF